MKMHEEIIKSSLDQETFLEKILSLVHFRYIFKPCKHEHEKLHACTVLWIQTPPDVTTLLVQIYLKYLTVEPPNNFKYLFGFVSGTHYECPLGIMNVPLFTEVFT